MIEKRTVLILGAGASVEYGYPVGSGLKIDILAKSSCQPLWKLRIGTMQKANEYGPLKEPIDSIAFFVHNCGFSLDKIEEFRTNFETSPKASIDAFLENRPEFLELGKLLISMCIHSYEDIKFISNNPNPNHWYGYLFNKMASSWENFQKNKISIVTYNYDRSFETYFIAALKATFGKSEQECIEVFNSTISIVHIHGVIAGLPFAHADKPYSSETRATYVREGASTLKIIHETTEIEAGYQQVHNLLNDAEQILILGFGFDEKNVERLNLSNYAAPIYATRKGISDLNLLRINELAKGSILFSPTQSTSIVDFLENDVSIYGTAAVHMPKKATPIASYVDRRE